MSETIMAGVNQSTWWRDKDHIHHLIDDMDESYRANVARLLIDMAAAKYGWHRQYEIQRSYWSFQQYMSEKDWLGNADESEPTRDEVRRIIRSELDRGRHLDWMRSRPQFIRMILGIEDQLSPGVLP